MTKTTTTRPTRQQAIALRAMLAARRQIGPIVDAIDAGIDACRSPEYHRALDAYTIECKARRDQGQPTDDLEPPRAERVPGATELRAWLRSELDRITLLRTKRARRRFGLDAHTTLLERAVLRTAGQVREAYYACDYRKSHSTWAGGEHALKVDVGRGTWARGLSERAWSDNRKWSGNNSAHDIGVPLSWLVQVQARGLAVLDRRLPLSAQPMAARPGEEAYEIAYAAQGRGFELQVKHGVAYRRTGGGWVVAGSLAAARRATKAGGEGVGAAAGSASC